jgi:hypothetical protein
MISIGIAKDSMVMTWRYSGCHKIMQFSLLGTTDT